MMMKGNNPVAKFSRRFNKSVKMVDRKREEKKTHKQQTLDEMKMVDSDGKQSVY
jgi:hypothetical protein